jgi:hypothetical protein
VWSDGDHVCLFVCVCLVCTAQGRWAEAAGAQGGLQRTVAALLPRFVLRHVQLLRWRGVGCVGVGVKWVKWVFDLLRVCTARVLCVLCVLVWG